MDHVTVLAVDEHELASATSISWTETGERDPVDPLSTDGLESLVVS